MEVTLYFQKNSRNYQFKIQTIFYELKIKDRSTDSNYAYVGIYGFWLHYEHSSNVGNVTQKVGNVTRTNFVFSSPKKGVTGREIHAFSN